MDNTFAAVLPRRDYFQNKPFTFSSTVQDWSSVRNRIFIQDLGNGLSFTEPMPISYHMDEGYYVAEIDAGGYLIASAENNLTSLKEDLKSQFQHAWNFFALEKDDKLNSKAKEVKRWLRARVRKH